MSFDPNKLKDYPKAPGVYIMRDKSGEVLYVGKAKELQARIRQYFVKGGDGRWIIPYLQDLVVEIDTIVTLTEKEALLLECNLIKKEMPRFNALLKDDKTYTAIKLNSKHPWPMLSLVRYKEKLKGDGEYFGPYTSAHAARQTLDLLQRVFPLRQCSDEELKRRTRPCILYGMKRCTAPCVNYIEKNAYDSLVDGARRFLKGDVNEVIRPLEKKMYELSDQLAFEEADEVLKLIESLKKTTEVQRVDQPKKAPSRDVIGMFREGERASVSVLLFREGRLDSYQHFLFPEVFETDEELVETFLLQKYLGSSSLPKEIFLPLLPENTSAIEELLEEKVTILSPIKGERKKLVDLAKKNAEAFFQQKSDREKALQNILAKMQESFHLLRYPDFIECIDTSHLGGVEAVSSLVAFQAGVPDKKNYRKYRLKHTLAHDDYGALKEVLRRRFSAEKMQERLPDLLIIDGGKAHLETALRTLKELNVVSVDVIAIAKEEGRHDRGVTGEVVFLKDQKSPFELPRRSDLIFFLQRVRDEAHRFAITYQKVRRTKSTLRTSLREIPGIGPKKGKALLIALGSVKKVREASDEELLAVKGVTKKDVEAIRKFFLSEKEEIS